MIPRPLLIHCGQCKRGIVPDASGFGWPCPFCGGYGSLSVDRLAALLGVPASAIDRVLKQPLRARTNVRGARSAALLCERLCAWLESPTKESKQKPKQRQGELFA